MSQRLQRVSELIRAEVSGILLRGLKDPRITGLITVTDVWVSGDLREARVYVSIYGASEQEKRRALAGLQSAKAYVRREVASAIKLRVSPSIDFALDEGIERGNAVIEKMREIGLEIDEKPRAPAEFDDDFSNEATTLDDPRTTHPSGHPEDRSSFADDAGTNPDATHPDATAVVTPAHVDPLAKTDPKLERPPGLRPGKSGEKR